jgi:hypothetical protein
MDDDEFRVNGVSMRVASTQNNTVIVKQLVSIPFFELVDDDVAQPPFLQVPPMGNNAQGGTPFALMQTSEDPTRNLYAMAYVKPEYDLRTLGTAPFSLNVNPGTELTNQLRAQTMTSSDGYWLVYVQGAFQGPAFWVEVDRDLVDADPNSEIITTSTRRRSPVSGETSASVDSTGLLYNIGGSTIYREILRDVLANQQLDCLTGTVVHETGHQFGLIHDGMGIMLPCSATRPLTFTDYHLNAIRRRPHPQG